MIVRVDVHLKASVVKKSYCLQIDDEKEKLRPRVDVVCLQRCQIICFLEGKNL